MTARRLSGLLAVISCLLLTSPSGAENFQSNRFWAQRGALSIPKKRVEFGFFSMSRVGLTDRLELGVHPIFLFFSPRLELKANWWSELTPRQVVEARSGWALSSLHALGYPTRFLQLVERQGSLGLLPENTSVPFAIQLDTGLVITRYQRGHALSVSLVGSVAPHEKDELPLLDFPFLYQRMAPFYAPFVPRIGISASGALFRSLSYDFSSQLWYLPIEPGHGVRRAWALESTAALRWTFFERHRISLGLALSTAEYPIGVRTHGLPTVDYRLSVF